MKMNKLIYLVMLLLMMGTISIAFFACGDDDDDDVASVDDDDSDDDDDDDDDDDNVDDDDDDTESPKISGNVIDPSTMQNVASATVTILDNTTGNILDAQLTTTTDESGFFEISVPFDVESVGLQLAKEDYYDTYYYHIAVQADNTVYLYPSEPINEVFDYLGVTYDTQKGILMGKVHWLNDQNAGEIIGCAVVTSQPASGTIYYFNAAGEPDAARTSTDPDNADFLGVNVDAGAATFTATVDSLSIDYSIPQIRANSVTDVSMIFTTQDSATNPTPEGCE